MKHYYFNLMNKKLLLIDCEDADNLGLSVDEVFELKHLESSNSNTRRLNALRHKAIVWWDTFTRKYRMVANVKDVINGHVPNNIPNTIEYLLNKKINLLNSDFDRGRKIDREERTYCNPILFEEIV